MSSRSPRKRKKAVIFNEDVTARLLAMGYTTKPRAYGEAPRSLGEDSSSPAETEEDESSGSTTDDEAEADASPSKVGGSAGMTIYEMMRKAEEGAARLEGRDEEDQESTLTDDSVDPQAASPKRSRTRTKKERPRLSFAELTSLVARHKETAVTSREAQLEKIARAVGRRTRRKGSLLPASELKPRRVRMDDCSSEHDSSSEEDELESIGASSPLKTPSALLSKMALSSHKKPPTSSSSAAKPSHAASSPIPFGLSPQSPFYRAPPSRIKKPPYITSHSSIFADLEIPPFFSGRALGSRLLRQRISWIFATARDLARQPEKVMWKDEKWLAREIARLVGSSDEWWRVNLGFFRDEEELQLQHLLSFRCFEAGLEGDDPPVALYYSFVLHWKLCGHDESECRFMQALVVYHSYRLPAKAVGKVLLPKSFDRDAEEVQKEWIRFTDWWLDLAEENGWEIRTGGVQRARSGSPRKRRKSTLSAKGRPLGLADVKREALGDRFELG